jgi:hypothetical protein
MLVGAQLAGSLFNAYLQGAGALSLEQWSNFWVWPAMMSLLVMVAFGILFREGNVPRV